MIELNKKGKNMKILFIGNSYTYFNDLPKMFDVLCRENGKDVSVYSLTVGGRELHQNLNPSDEKYVELVEYLKDGHPDVLIMQEQSVLPAINYGLFLQGVQGLHDLVKANKTILYATWGRHEGSHVLTDHGWTTDSMTCALYGSYSQAADEIGGDVSPVGLCFTEMNHKHPEVELYDPDHSHPSLYGSVLALICHYYTVFGELPRACTIPNVAADIIDAMKDVISAVWAKEKNHV